MYDIYDAKILNFKNMYQLYQKIHYHLTSLFAVRFPSLNAENVTLNSSNSVTMFIKIYDPKLNLTHSRNHCVSKRNFAGRYILIS